MFHRNASNQERALRSQRMSHLHQQQRQKEVRAKTYDMLRSFDQHVKSFHKTFARADVDDLPLNATAQTMRSTSHSHFQHDHQDANSDSSDSPRSPGHGARMLRKSSSEAYMGHHDDHELDHDDKARVRRPPSPLSHYDYGAVNLRPRSAVAQKRCPARENATTNRHKASVGMYFPGPDHKQGPYGFSMQDPILMPQRCWEPKRGPQRCNQQANDVRPRHQKAAPNDAKVVQSHVSKPTCPELVRNTRGHDAKSQHVARYLDRLHDENVLEHVRHEEGTFEGRWCHPVKHRSATHLHDGPLGHFDWMEQELSESDEAELLASRILAGITRTLQEEHTTVSRLFKPVNRACQGVLEMEEFMEGLTRMHIIEYEDVTSLKLLSDVVSLLDPDFDGRVTFPALARAVQAAQQVQTKHAKATNATLKKQVITAKAGGPYGHGEKIIPVEVVKVDMNSKSKFDFIRSRDEFLQQQKDLLIHHGERVEVD